MQAAISLRGRPSLVMRPSGCTYSVPAGLTVTASDCGSTAQRASPSGPGSGVLQLLAGLALLAGLGLVRLPKWLVAPDVASGQLLQVFDEPEPFGFPMHLLWPHSRRLPLKTRVVLDLLAHRLPGLLEAS